MIIQLTREKKIAKTYTMTYQIKEKEKSKSYFGTVYNQIMLL